MKANWQDIIVNFAPTGILPGKEQNRSVPISVDEIVDQVLEACDLGITIAHLHARTPTGEPSPDPETYAKIIQGIRRSHPELVICVSLSGRACPDYNQRAAPIHIGGNEKPDMGSLTLGSLNFKRDSSINTPDTVHRLATEMSGRGIVPELEVFDLGMVNVARSLVASRVLAAPLYFNLLLGNVASAQADLLHAGLLVRELPEGSLWSFGGIGASQLPANLMAIAAGGGVRVGLEDNLYFDSAHKRLASNRELVQRVVTAAKLSGRSVMRPSTFRRIMDMEPGGGRYGRQIRTREDVA